MSIRVTSNFVLCSATQNHTRESAQTHAQCRVQHAIAVLKL